MSQTRFAYEREFILYVIVVLCVEILRRDEINVFVSGFVSEDIEERLHFSVVVRHFFEAVSALVQVYTESFYELIVIGDRSSDAAFKGSCRAVSLFVFLLPAIVHEKAS